MDECRWQKDREEPSREAKQEATILDAFAGNWGGVIAWYLGCELLTSVKSSRGVEIIIFVQWHRGWRT